MPTSTRLRRKLRAARLRLAKLVRGQDPERLQAPSGRTMYVDLRDKRARLLARSEEGTFNPSSIAMWRKLVRVQRWDLIIDIGANYGEMVLDLDGTEAGTIVAVEPNPRVGAYLCRSLEEAALPVHFVPVAIADASGAEHFLVDRKQSGLSHLVQGQQDTAQLVDIVPTTTLDELVFTWLGLAASAAQRVLIKSDVEGAEIRVLTGAQRLIRDAHEIAIMLETVHLSVKELDKLESDFKISRYFPQTGEFGFEDLEPPSGPARGSPFLQDAVIHRSAERDGALADLLAGRKPDRVTSDLRPS